MKKETELRILAMRIEYHWWFIMRGRKKGNKLIDAGQPLSSPMLLALNDRLTRHCVRVMKYTKRYEDLAGITSLLGRSQ